MQKARLVTGLLATSGSGFVLLPGGLWFGADRDDFTLSVMDKKVFFRDVTL